jgi:hypothetical protein
MYQIIKEEIKDIIDIVNQCPDPLKEKCFEILLTSLLNDTSSKKINPKVAPKETQDKQDIAEGSANTPFQEKDEEISKKDLHVKTKKIIDSEGITYDVINHLYYKDGDNILPLYDDLGSNKMSESQIRLCLLMAFENSFKSGEFEVSGEEVRKKCQLLKCYDSPNFAANFKNNKLFFDSFDAYDKNTPLRLSSEGKKELAKVLKSIAK